MALPAYVEEYAVPEGLDEFLTALEHTPTPIHAADEWRDIPSTTRLQNLRHTPFKVRDAENLIVISPSLPERDSVHVPLGQPVYRNIPTRAAVEDLATLLRDVYGIATAYDVVVNADGDRREVLVMKPRDAADQFAYYADIVRAWDDALTPEGRNPSYPAGLGASMARAASRAAPLVPVTGSMIEEAGNPGYRLAVAMQQSVAGKKALESLRRLQDGNGQASDVTRVTSYCECVAHKRLAGVDPEVQLAIAHALSPAVALLKQMPARLLSHAVEISLP